MKELSNEDKAKRYDEALHKAKRIIDVCVDDNTECRSMIACIQQIFPELKEESEGERIRKRICKLLWDNAPYEEAQEYITWLEKQGNPTEDELEALRMAAYEPIKNWSEKLQSLYEKLTHREQKPVIEMKTPEESLGIDSNTYNKIVDECIYGEQKPAWSEEDETKIKSIIALLKSPALCTMDGNKGIIDESIKYLKSIKYRVGCEVNCTTKQQWKPSDEQMKQLGWIAKQNKDNMIGKELMSLYQDLKNKV